MKRTLTRKWDPAEHLKTAADIAAYRKAVRGARDPQLLLAVKNDIARALRAQRRRRKGV